MILFLDDKLSNQNHKNPFPICFCFFEIVLACSSSSLRTISGTDIFGAVSRDKAEVYIPWDIIIHLILRGEQSQKIF